MIPKNKTTMDKKAKLINDSFVVVVVDVDKGFPRYERFPDFSSFESFPDFSSCRLLSSTIRSNSFLSWSLTSRSSRLSLSKARTSIGRRCFGGFESLTSAFLVSTISGRTDLKLKTHWSFFWKIVSGGTECQSMVLVEELEVHAWKNISNIVGSRSLGKVRFLTLFFLKYRPF